MNSRVTVALASGRNRRGFPTIASASQRVTIGSEGQEASRAA